MSIAPVYNGGKYASSFIDATISNGTQYTTNGASAHTKKGYTVFESSVPMDSWGFRMTVRTHARSIGFLADIAIGAVSSEKIIIPDFYISAPKDMRHKFEFPLFIPEGEQMHINAQSASGSHIFPAFTWLGGGAAGGPVPLFNECRAMGNDNTDTTLVSVDPGATANSYGAYTQIEASTPIDFGMLMVIIGGQDNSVRSIYDWSFKLAVGAAAAEKDILEEVVSCNSSGDSVEPGEFNVWKGIPAGTRLSIALSCSGTDATDRLLDFMILGFGG